jgi:hypothetical protein
LAGQVLLKITYLLMRWFFSLAVLLVRGDRAKNAELLVLRHENAVLRRNAGRIRYDPADRVWFSALTRSIPRRRWAEVFAVTPAIASGAPRAAPSSRAAGRPGPACAAGSRFPSVMALLRDRDRDLVLQWLRGSARGG